MFNRIETFVNENSLRVSLALAFSSLLLIGFAFFQAATGSGVLCAEAAGSCEEQIESLYEEGQQITSGNLIYNAAVISMRAQSGSSDYLDTISAAYAADAVHLQIDKDYASHIITVNSDCTSPAAGAICLQNDEPLVMQGLNFILRLLMREGSDYWVEVSRTVPYGNPSATAFNNSSQVLTHGAWKTMNLNSEIDDPLGWHSTSSNNYRFYPNRDGNYLVTVQNFSFTANANGRRIIRIQDNHNNVWNEVRIPASPIGDTKLAVTAQRHIDEGDYIYVRAYQDSGSSVSVSAYYKVTVTYINDQ